MRERLRKPRTMGQLQPGVQVMTPDGERWVIQSHSSYTANTRRDQKWLWLRRGHSYRKINGNDFFTLRLILLAQEELCSDIAPASLA